VKQSSCPTLFRALPTYRALSTKTDKFPPAEWRRGSSQSRELRFVSGVLERNGAREIEENTAATEKPAAAPWFEESRRCKDTEHGVRGVFGG
jgi:hypothetical protein